MEKITNTNIEFNADNEFDELDEISPRAINSSSNYMGDSRYSIIGNADEQWGFVHSISEICRERFNEDDFEAELFKGDGFTVFNKNSNGALILFQGKSLKLTAQDIGFILGYRLSLAKRLDKVSEAMYGCAKEVLSSVCFKDFFVMVDWKKINFYSLFEVVPNKVGI
jgi:hypothetical protein